MKIPLKFLNFEPIISQIKVTTCLYQEDSLVMIANN